MTRTVMIIEDHYFVRFAIENLLKDIKKDINIISAANLKDATDMLKNIKNDIHIISDLDLSDSCGFNTIKNILKINKNNKILVMSANDDIEFQCYLKKYGIYGYITKNKSMDDIIGYLDNFLEGDRVFDPIVNLSSCEKLEIKYSRIKSLSFKQLSILREFSQGKSLNDIAIDKKLNVSTLNNYISDIIMKLRCKNRYQASTEYKYLSKFGFVD